MLQMGLNVLSVEGLLLKKVKHWMLKCHACFKYDLSPYHDSHKHHLMAGITIMIVMSSMAVLIERGAGRRAR